VAAAQRLVYGPEAAVSKLRGRLDGQAELVPAGGRPRLGDVLADVARRGAARIMVEGGAQLGSELLRHGLVDELQLAVAPFFVGDPAAPRFAGPGHYPAGPGHPLTLAEARPVGGVVLLRYIRRNGPDRAS
jgi:5-amino-6-(5-phosphoribosylamino)uracil reductase